MAVFQLGTATLDKLFLEYILPGLHVQIMEHSKLYGRFKTDTEHVVGKYAVIKALTGAPKSARPSSSSSLPTPSQGTYDEFIIKMKRGIYAQLQFDGLALACSKGKGAVVEALKSEIDAITIQIGRKANRILWGDGSGRLAQVKGAVNNSTTIYVDSPYFGTNTSYFTSYANWLDVGQEIDIYDGSGNLQAEGITITAISDDSGNARSILTVDTAVTVSDDAWIFDHDTYTTADNAGEGYPMGLIGIVNTANPYFGITQGYFQNVDRTTNTWAQATVISAGTSATQFSNLILLRALMDVEKYGKIKVIITNEFIWRAIYSVWEQSLQPKPEPALWGGVTGLSFYGGKSGKIPIIYDFDCPDERIYLLDDSYLSIFSPYEKSGMTWLPGDNGILTRVHGKDEYVASLVHYFNFGCSKPKAQAMIYNVRMY